MRRVYICSPLGGNVSANIENAKRYARYALECGMAPFIPHFYALILDDSNKEERSLGMLAGLSMLWVCDAVWVFGDEITEGMKTEIRFAEKLNIKVRYISENDLRKSEVKNDKIKNNYVVEVVGRNISTTVNARNIGSNSICRRRCIISNRKHMDVGSNTD